MELIFMIYIIVIVAVVFLVAFLTKSVIKTIAAFILLFFLMIAITGLLVYQDAQEIKEKFESEPKMFLAQDNSNLITGVKIAQDNEFLTQKQIESYNFAFNSNNLEKIRGNNYKVFFFDIQIINQIESNNLKINDLIFTKKEIIDFLRSEDPYSKLVTKIAKQENAPESVVQQTLKSQKKMQINFDDPSQIKAMIFAGALSNSIGKNPTALIKYFKNDLITIYPETITFKVIKLLPNSLFNKLIAMST